MKWSLGLHIYQPPTQREDIVKLVTEECYLPLLNTLIGVDLPFMLNVTATLIEQWDEQGYKHVIDLVKKLQSKKNVTLTASSYTHALLPLWSEEEIAYQIDKNTSVINQHISGAFRPKGIYLPECAVSPRLARQVKQLGFEWTIIDQISLTRKEYVPAIRDRKGLKYLVRNREMSRLLATDTTQFVNELGKQTKPIFVMLDGEVFGHFDPSAINRLLSTLSQTKKEVVSYHDLLKKAPQGQIRSGTWETEMSDLKAGKPFPLWKDKNNRTHRLIWRHLKNVYRAVSESGGLEQNEWVRKHYDNAMSSCYTWWANLTRTAGPFKLEIWNPDVIVAGLTEAIKAVRSDSLLDKRQKYLLETEHANILKDVWQTHWKYKG